MIFTPRSIAVGLVSWLLAFTVAYAGGINPAHLSAWHISLLVLSAIAGVLSVVALGKKYCHHDFERCNAVMVFATSWFVGIYTPIVAIWANAPFYAWAASLTAKPKSIELGPMLAPVIEKLAVSLYLGVGALFTAGYFVMRRTKATVSCAAKGEPPREWNLDKVDFSFGALAFMAGLLLAKASEVSKLTEPVQWLVYSSGAFLLCFLFRSLRLHSNALREQMTDADGPQITKKGGTFCVVALWLCWLSFLLLSRFCDLVTGSGLVLCLVMFLMPWFFFRRIAGQSPAAAANRAQLLGQFAMRCGFWSGLTCSLMIGGFVFPGIAKSELAKAGEISTPFAFTVLAMKPLFCISVLPAVGAWIGAFVLTWAFPRSTRASERILACAQGGAVMSVATYVCLILFALSLAILTVASIPVHGAPHIPELSKRFVTGNWVALGWLYMGFLAVGTIGGAAFWALEATIDCGLIWLRDRSRGNSAPYRAQPPGSSRPTQ